MQKLIPCIVISLAVGFSVGFYFRDFTEYLAYKFRSLSCKAEDWKTQYWMDMCGQYKALYRDSKEKLETIEKILRTEKK